MTTKFVKQGTMYMPTDNSSLDVRDQLPPGNYIIKQLPTGQLVFDSTESFVMPPKLYGDCIKNADRIYNTFTKRPNSTGAMLNGEKGSGKTLLAKYLSIMGAKEGVPTILINSPWTGEAFMQLVQSVNQPCIVIFDEFEKVYDADDQEDILTMLDGVFPSKKLFIFTCNDKWKVNQHMRNRPGRIFYYIEYSGLDTKFIREYCEDNLTNKGNIDSVVVLSHMFDHFNFDMLASIVEEMNRYDETALQSISILNARPEFSMKQMFDMSFTLNDVPCVLEDTEIAINPITAPAIMAFYCMPKEKKVSNVAPLTVKSRKPIAKEDWRSERFEFKDLVKVDADEGRFIYQKGNMKLTLVRHVEPAVNYDGLL